MPGKTTTRIRRRKVGGDSGYMVCNVCHGTGRQKIPNRRVKNSKGKLNAGR